MTHLLASLRLCLCTMLVCSFGYTLAVLGFADLVTPATAAGSLLRRADGSVLGSRLLAQAFSSERYFWPRPSAVAYDAAAGGGSNLSPTSAALTTRAAATVAAFGASTARPLPADLAAASGSGLDPHLSEAAARYQLARIAAARQLPVPHLAALLERLLFTPGGPFGRGRVVNVLELNLALDSLR